MIRITPALLALMVTTLAGCGSPTDRLSQCREASEAVCESAHLGEEVWERFFEEPNDVSEEDFVKYVDSVTMKLRCTTILTYHCVSGTDVPKDAGASFFFPRIVP